MRVDIKGGVLAQPKSKMQMKLSGSIYFIQIQDKNKQDLLINAQTCSLTAGTSYLARGCYWS
jgi:hypothetical protein